MTYHPYYITGEERASRWLVTCDHATNTVPSFVGGGTLGLSAVDMGRHIAFDPGAAGVSLALAEALGAPCITSNFSRLVIDPNRGEDDPTLVMKLYDGTLIPANRHIEEAELNLRLNRCYRPYHTALARLASTSGQHDHCRRSQLYPAAARPTPPALARGRPLCCRHAPH